MEKKIPGWFKKADDTVLKIYKYVSYIALISLVAIMLIAFFDVIGEKLSKIGVPVHGISGYSDWIAYLHVPVVFFSAGYITLERGHTCVDILTSRLNKVIRKVTAYIGFIIGIAITVLMTARGYVLLKDIYEHHTTIGTSSYSFPQWPFAFMYLCGMIMLTFSFVWALLRMVFGYSPEIVSDPFADDTGKNTTEKGEKDS
ncbi:MAG: TRAP transporter small permease [Eubacterium sp.]|nr:TRAP transporter small permease [Eubacterium sp.]